jgi:hypothetical protein
LLSLWSVLCPSPRQRATLRLGFWRPWARPKLALEYLERGFTRDAAGMAFHAWKALLAALLRLEQEKLKALAKTEEEKKWLESKAVPRVPTTRMKELGRLLEEAGHYGISAWTAVALDLHDYQHHGPDPDTALSKYTTRQSAAADALYSSKSPPDA